MSAPVATPLVKTPDGMLVLDEPIDLLGYQRDCSSLPAGAATQVARPRDARDVASVLVEAGACGRPVYVRGGGTMYAGGVNPAAGGVVLDMTGLDRILEVDPKAGVVVVEPGVKFGALAAALAPHGLTIGIIPSTAPAATVGGAASAHALGTGSARFQSFADEVVGLEVVLPDGRLLRTGSAAAPAGRWFHRFGMGPDLTGLFLGGDATFGVITKIALWLHPLPTFRTTACYGFPDAAAAANFILGLQQREWLQHVWYGSGYEGGTVRARVTAARPDLAPDTLPGFCVGLDFGGEEDLVARDRERILALAAASGGSDFELFNQLYFQRLRGDQIYWYTFAGYFARSRCGLLMASLPTDGLPAFTAALDGIRAAHPGYVWGGAVVLCRRGLHGGVLGFYDEATQWQAVQPVMRDCASRLAAAGCTPYKTGKMWAPEVQAMAAYHGVLQQLKKSLDPGGLMSPGNLGL